MQIETQRRGAGPRSVALLLLCGAFFAPCAAAQRLSAAAGAAVTWSNSGDWVCPTAAPASRTGVEEWPLVNVLQGLRLVPMDEAALSRLRHASAVSVGAVEPHDAETEATAMMYVFALDLCVWIGAAALVFIVGAVGAAAFCGHQLCTCRKQCPKLHARVMATLAFLCRGTNGENEDDEHDWNGGSAAVTTAASSRLGRAGGVAFDAGQIGEREEYTPCQRAVPLAVWLGAALLLVGAASAGAAFTATLVEATQFGSLEAHCMAGEIEAWSAALGGALDNATAESRDALRDASDILDALLLDSTVGFRELATENGDGAAALAAAQGRHAAELGALAPADGPAAPPAPAIDTTCTTPLGNALSALPNARCCPASTASCCSEARSHSSGGIDPNRLSRRSSTCSAAS